MQLIAADDVAIGHAPVVIHAAVAAPTACLAVQVHALRLSCACYELTVVLCCAASSNKSALQSGHVMCSCSHFAAHFRCTSMLKREEPAGLNAATSHTQHNSRVISHNIYIYPPDTPGGSSKVAR
eukprot:9604-Heterococcus_DN1.PRE.9